MKSPTPPNGPPSEAQDAQGGAVVSNNDDARAGDTGSGLHAARATRAQRERELDASLIARYRDGETVREMVHSGIAPHAARRASKAYQAILLLERHTTRTDTGAELCRQWGVPERYGVIARDLLESSDPAHRLAVSKLLRTVAKDSEDVGSAVEAADARARELGRLHGAVCEALAGHVCPHCGQPDSVLVERPGVYRVAWPVGAPRDPSDSGEIEKTQRVPSELPKEEEELYPSKRGVDLGSSFGSSGLIRLGEGLVSMDVLAEAERVRRGGELMVPVVPYVEPPEWEERPWLPSQGSKSPRPGAENGKKANSEALGGEDLPMNGEGVEV